MYVSVVNYRTTACMTNPGLSLARKVFYVLGKLVNFLASVSPFDK